MPHLIYQNVSENKIYEKDHKNIEKAHALELINKYGTDSLSYLALSNDRHYFFGHKVEGLVAYRIINKIVICLGDPICRIHDIEEFINEFKYYCKINKYKICFCSISNHTRKFLSEDEFCISKYGEEALIDLWKYEMRGSSTLKLRQKIRKAEKDGLRVIEYHPKKERDLKLEMEICKISEEWLSHKKSKLNFSVGELQIDSPFGRKYFISIDKAKKAQAVLVFTPFLQGKGYFLDVMRRKLDATSGTMEHAIINASLRSKEEGISFISLGVAPLTGIITRG
ncbi:MAG: hypothetical protein APF84_17130 [Gracilibacter sp. BRH_c7a]|nr:MAG: hypothetical protein APF84_17130 [Gracilibacter sp. BRH_c7a]